LKISKVIRRLDIRIVSGQILNVNQVKDTAPIQINNSMWYTETGHKNEGILGYL